VPSNFQCIATKYGAFYDALCAPLCGAGQSHAFQAWSITINFHHPAEKSKGLQKVCPNSPFLVSTCSKIMFEDSLKFGGSLHKAFNQQRRLVSQQKDFE
jgi:hypothetical protein